MRKKRKLAATESSSGWSRRVHPKLRMMLNGDPTVNACRAETTGAVFVSAKLARQAAPIASAISPADVSDVKLKKLDRKNAQRSEVRVNVFVETTQPMTLPSARGQEGNFAVLQVPLDEVPQLAQREGVAFIEPAENLKDPGSIKIATKAKAPAPRSVAIGNAKQHRNGKGVMIGIIDVQGFDWL